MRIRYFFVLLLCLYSCHAQEDDSADADHSETGAAPGEKTTETESPAGTEAPPSEEAKPESESDSPASVADDVDAGNTTTTTDNGEPECGSNTLLAILIPTAIYALVLSVLVPILVYRLRAKRCSLREDEILNFIKPRESMGSQSSVVLQYDRDRYELSPTEFRIKSEQALGSGMFGLVCLGSIIRGAGIFPVAVKVVKKDSLANIYEDTRKQVMKTLLSELQILSSVGRHPNIIKLEGAYTQNLRRGELYVFLEYCALGSLQKYLQTYRTENSDDIICGDKETMDDDLAEDLRKWSVEIASGMEHLASHNVFHGDLSLRNILLNSAKSAKISDFGLSRYMYDNLYVKSTQEPLPWRWMAPESLSRMIFNEKTDVWAFGVTLWEMYTLGNIPYSGLSWEINFVTRLEGGLRLPEPKCNDNKIYTVMAHCWNFDPEIRPKFSELRTSLIQRWKKNTCSEGYTVFIDESEYTDIPL